MVIRRWMAGAALFLSATAGLQAQSALDPAEFEKVQAEMNARIEALESELQASREERQAREAHYEQQIRDLQEQVQDAQVPPAAEPAAPEGKQEWSVRRVPAAPAEPQEEFGALFEAKPAEDSSDTPAVEADVAPVEVTDVVRVGRKRLTNRREEMRWRPAMQFTVRNLGEAPLQISAWAHQPGHLGWQLDEFGATLFTLPAKGTVTNKLLAHDEGMDLYLLIQGKTYTYPVKSK